MQSQNQQQPFQHYFHQQLQYGSKRSNVRSLNIHIPSNPTQTSRFFAAAALLHVCLSNGNAVQIYRIGPTSVDFYMRKQFFCNIRKLQVIPCLHKNASDYIFILDELGRYTFWRPCSQPTQPDSESQIQTLTSNVIQKQATNKKRYYKEEVSPEQEELFTGTSLRYEVNDTAGFVFYTVESRIIVLKIQLKAKDRKLKILETRSFEIPYVRFRYVGCLNSSGLRGNSSYQQQQNFTSSSSSEDLLFIGIVQQIQQRTVLKVHKLSFPTTTITSTKIQQKPHSHQLQLINDSQSLEWRLEKVNILQFSSGQHNEIIVLTYDQISIYKVVPSCSSSSNLDSNPSPICNYRTRGNYGSVCYIPPSQSITKQATYIHLGFEMTVFTKFRLANYGSLKYDGRSLLEGSGIVESVFLGGGGGDRSWGQNNPLQHPNNMIAFVTNFSEVYFVRLYQNSFEVIRRIKSISSVFSLHGMGSESGSGPGWGSVNNKNLQPNPNSLIAVHSSYNNGSDQSNTSSQVSLIQQVSPSILQQQQRLSHHGQVIKIGDGRNSTNQSHFILSSNNPTSNHQNLLLEWSEQKQCFVNEVMFPKQQYVLACTDRFVVLTSGVYDWKVETQQVQQNREKNDMKDEARREKDCQEMERSSEGIIQEKMEVQGEEKNENKKSVLIPSTTLKQKKMILNQLQQEQNILSAVYNSNYIGYYTSQGIYKFLQLESSTISRIRKNCLDEYIWYMLGEIYMNNEKSQSKSKQSEQQNILVYASYSEPGTLKVLDLNKAVQTVSLQTKQLISCIGEIRGGCSDNGNRNNSNSIPNLIIGYYNGTIQIYSLTQKRTLSIFNIGVGINQNHSKQSSTSTTQAYSSSSSTRVSICSYRDDCMVVYTSEKQYMLYGCGGNDSSTATATTATTTMYQLHQVQFTSATDHINKTNTLCSINYLSHVDKFLLGFQQKTILDSQLSAQSFIQSSPITILQLRSLKLPTSLTYSELNLQLKSSLRVSPIFKCQEGPPEVVVVQVACHDSADKKNRNKSQLMSSASTLITTFAYIGIGQTLLKYNPKTKQLLKRQLHILSQIASITVVQAGVLLAGVDMMDNGIVVLFDLQDLSQLGSYSLGKGKRPYSIKAMIDRRDRSNMVGKSSEVAMVVNDDNEENKNQNNNHHNNKFVVKYDTFLSVLQVQQCTNNITELYGVNTKTTGYTIDVIGGVGVGGNNSLSNPHPSPHKILTTDPYRYLIVYEIGGTRDILPVAKYFGSYLINDAVFLQGSVVTGDRGGFVNVLEFNQSGNGNGGIGGDDISRLAMTSVGKIYVGEEVFTLKRVESASSSPTNVSTSTVYYGCSSGTIGKIRSISPTDFQLLKRIQQDAIAYLEMKGNGFSYEHWRSRVPQNDKLIDQALIRFYLTEFNGKGKVRVTQGKQLEQKQQQQRKFYSQVKQLYERCIA